jgi:hypothetical protein
MPSLSQNPIPQHGTCINSRLPPLCTTQQNVRNGRCPGTAWSGETWLRREATVHKGTRKTRDFIRKLVPRIQPSACLPVPVEVEIDPQLAMGSKLGVGYISFPHASSAHLPLAADV